MPTAPPCRKSYINSFPFCIGTSNRTKGKYGNRKETFSSPATIACFFKLGKTFNSLPYRVFEKWHGACLVILEILFLTPEHKGMKKADKSSKGNLRGTLIERRCFYYSAHIPERRKDQKRRLIDLSPNSDQMMRLFSAWGSKA